MARWLWTHEHDQLISVWSARRWRPRNSPSTSFFTGGFTTWSIPGPGSPTGGASGCASGASCGSKMGAVDSNAVNAAAVDGLQIEPVILAELRLGRRFWLGAGYGLTIMPSVTVTNSIFGPTAAGTARAPPSWRPQYRALQSGANGTARPSADGTYTSLVQDFGLTFTFRL